MSLELPLALGGPVLDWELLRGARRWWPRLLFAGYAVWLVIVFFSHEFTPSVPEPDYQMKLRTPAQRAAWIMQHRQAAALAAMQTFAMQQLALLVLVTPAVTAGALAIEKERNTLQALFCTELSDWQIVLGKLLGRLIILTWLGFLSLPFLVILAETASLPLLCVLLLQCQAGMLAFALGATCMLCSVWTKQTRDAVLAFYSVIVLGYLGGAMLFATVSLPVWLDPVAMAGRLTEGRYSGDSGWPWAAHLVFFGAVGLVSTACSVWSLRRASLRQLEERPHRWLWAYRAAVSDYPVYWRERHVIGLAPLPVLRIVPRSLARLGVLAFAMTLIYTGLCTAMGQNFTHAVSQLDFGAAYEMLQRVESNRLREEVVIMGVVVLVLGPLVTFVRCAGSVAEEKRRKTWEDLLLTPLSIEEILSDKLWGVLFAGTEYLAIYALPLLAFSLLGGGGGVFLAVLFLVFTWLGMLAGATMGIGYSGLAAEGTRTVSHWDRYQQS